MIIDGEELRMQCKRCGKKYMHIIGYGPICPNEWMRREILKKNPPQCPICDSSDYKRLSILDSILDFFK